MTRLRISKNSWHYKVVDFLFFASDNLCMYFWQVVGGLGVIFVLTTLFVMGVICAITFPITAVLIGMGVPLTDEMTKSLVTLSFFGFFPGLCV